jgi:hypothetical protein
LVDYVIVNNKSVYNITDRLGDGKLTSNEFQFKIIKVNTPGLNAKWFTYFAIEPQMMVINEGDTICFVGLNLNKDQYEFLKEFDNNATHNTSGNDLFNNDNIYDQLRIPTNLPTNIEPADKAAGYFFIYSISKISKVFNK